MNTFKLLNMTRYNCFYDWINFKSKCNSIHEMLKIKFIRNIIIKMYLHILHFLRISCPENRNEKNINRLDEKFYSWFGFNVIWQATKIGQRVWIENRVWSYALQENKAIQIIHWSVSCRHSRVFWHFNPCSLLM